MLDWMESYKKMIKEEVASGPKNWPYHMRHLVPYMRVPPYVLRDEGVEVITTEDFEELNPEQKLMVDEILMNVMIVLDHPRNVVNIAGVVRAMKNMGLTRLRLVRPEEFDPWRIEGI